jgi:hypothetical protein
MARHPMAENVFRIFCGQPPEKIPDTPARDGFDEGAINTGA